MSEYRFEILPANGGGYFWHFKAPNNEIVCSSQVYKNSESAAHGAQVLINHAAKAKIIPPPTGRIDDFLKGR